LPERYHSLVEQLARRLIEETEFVLVTGGVRAKSGRPASVDFVVANAAAHAAGTSERAAERILTVLPDLSERSEDERFELGTVARHVGYDRKMRRFRMVLDSSGVVAIHGGEGTSDVVRLAHMAGKPLLVLPSTGGAAKELWNRSGSDLVERLGITDDERAVLTRELGDDHQELVSTCVAVMRRNLRRRCFLAYAFDEAGPADPDVIAGLRAAARGAGFEPFDFRAPDYNGNISADIPRFIRESAFVIADLSHHRPNVYYEAGLSHALDKPTLLLVSRQHEDDVKFDLRSYRRSAYDGAPNAGEIAARWLGQQRP